MSALSKHREAARVSRPDSCPGGLRRQTLGIHQYRATQAHLLARHHASARVAAARAALGWDQLSTVYFRGSSNQTATVHLGSPTACACPSMGQGDLDQEYWISQEMGAGMQTSELQRNLGQADRHPFMN